MDRWECTVADIKQTCMDLIEWLKRRIGRRNRDGDLVSSQITLYRGLMAFRRFVCMGKMRVDSRNATLGTRELGSPIFARQAGCDGLRSARSFWMTASVSA